MIVESIEKMEKIVEANPTLEWDGWDVLWYKPFPAGFFKVDGAFHRGKWTILKRIEPSRQGWDVPRSFLRRT